MYNKRPFTYLFLMFLCFPFSTASSDAPTCTILGFSEPEGRQGGKGAAVITTMASSHVSASDEVQPKANWGTTTQSNARRRARRQENDASL